MLPEFLFEPQMMLAQVGSGGVFHLPTDAETNITMVLRWIHIFAGVVWIGHLYFFNLVNVNLMKSLDGPTKGKVIPQLLPRALWWFRWGALITVLAGVFYYIQILHAEPNTWKTFGIWTVIVVAVYVLIFFLLRQSFPPGKGLILGILVGVIVCLLSLLILYLIGSSEGVTRFGESRFASNRSLSIAIGGGLGVIMLFNVWGVIWPAQKRIIAWTYDNAESGTPIPPESASLARRAFLASRMNTWLSVPMLFFMISASHYSLFGK